MIKIAPAKALSVRVNENMRLEVVKKGKERQLTLTDVVHVLPKLDGIYAIKAGGMLRTRTMAPYRSSIQQRFHHLPDGICGELIVGSRLAHDAWAKTTSDVSMKEGPTAAVLHMFDFAAEGTFASRRARLLAYAGEHCGFIESFARINVKLGVVDIDPKEFKMQLTEYETLEGFVLRPGSSPYYASRSTAVNPFFMRIKGEETVDGIITDLGVRMHNGNVAKPTHDGKLRRHSFKGHLNETDMIGVMKVKLPDGKEVSVGTGFTMEQAKDMYKRASEIIGSTVELKRHTHVRGTLSGEDSEQGAYVFLRLRTDK